MANGTPRRNLLQLWQRIPGTNDALLPLEDAENLQLYE
jgi:hypothetical protein